MIYLVTGQSQLFEKELYKIISVEESLKLLEPLRIVGVDTETEGFSPFLKKLLMVQLGCFDFQVVIDCTTIEIGKYKDFLESDRLFILQNAKFDLRFFYKYNIILSNVWDTYIVEKLRYLGYPSGMHGLSLRSMCEEYCGVELDKSVRGKIHYAGLADDVIEYGANDVKYLEPIMNKQLEWVKERHQEIACSVENKFVKALAYMEFCGVKIDTDKWRAKMMADKVCLEEAEKALNDWVVQHYPNNSKFTHVNLQGDLFLGYDTTPKCLINWNSGKQVIPFFEELGFNLLTKDKSTGQMKKSVESDIIEKQKHLSDIAPVYLKYKAAQKVVSTYGQNFLDLINPVTKRIHTNFNQIGTDTCRLSSGGGDDKEVIPGRKIPLVNLQNLPHDAITRACFVAEPGNRWISADYCGEESVILANISQDKAMIELFTTGCKDLHSLVAKMCYKDELANIPVEQVKKQRPDLRQRAKAPEFTFAYGGDANTLAARDSIPMDEAIQIENNYKKGFPGVAKYQRDQKRLVMKQGYINTCPEIGYRSYIYDFKNLQDTAASFTSAFWTNYRQLKETNPTHPIVESVRHYFKRKSAIERQGVNYPIQSRGSAIFKIFSIYLFDWIVQSGNFGIVKYMVPAHDEANLEAPESIAEEVANKLSECMVKAGKFICKTVPLEVEVSRNKDKSLPTCWVH